jgi:hypothetical protein
MAVLRVYAEVRGLDALTLERAHLRYLETFQYWILERLGLLGYDGGTDVGAELLRARRAELAEAVDAVLGAFRTGPEGAAALPPLLTLPEKVVVVETLAPQLGETLRCGGGRWRSWLYVLHLAAPSGAPTRLGRVLLAALETGREPGRAYVETAERLGLLKWIVALETVALDVGTKNELDALLAAYAKYIRLPDLHVVYSAFRYMASDVRGITMVTPALPPERIFEMLETEVRTPRRENLRDRRTRGAARSR